MRRLLFFACILSLVPVSNLFAQEQNDGWEHIFLLVSGHNEIDGVKAWFKQVDCDGESVIHLKLTNTNQNAVTVSWYNAAFSQDLKWTRNEGVTESTVIGGGETVTGNCATSNELSIPVSNFFDDPKQFKRFSTNDFTVQPLR